MARPTGAWMKECIRSQGEGKELADKSFSGQASDLLRRVVHGTLLQPKPTYWLRESRFTTLFGNVEGNDSQTDWLRCEGTLAEF